MLLEERSRLHRVPDQPYTLAFGMSRTVGTKLPLIDLDLCQYSVPQELRGEVVWAREHGDEIVIVHVGKEGPVEVARHQRTTPGNPRIDPRHFGPPPEGRCIGRRGQGRRRKRSSSPSACGAHPGSPKRARPGCCGSAPR